MAQRTCSRKCSSCPAEAASPQEAVLQGWKGGGRRPWTCTACLHALRHQALEASRRRFEVRARLMAGPAGHLILLVLSE